MDTDFYTGTPQDLPRPRRRFGWRQAVLFSGALLGGTIAGAGGLSYAAIMTGSVNWHHGHRMEMLQRRVLAALDSVGATSTQENKIHDIIAQTFTTMGDDHAAARARREQMIALLRAPTIDRAAVEKLRAEQVAAFDAHTKAITGMILDSADQLSPDQRASLADRAEAMMAQGPRGWHKGHGDRDGGPEGGMDDQHGGGSDDGHGPGQDGTQQKNPG